MGTTEAARRLGIRHPIVQGPFGGGLSTPHLAATVANRGGLGSFGAHILSPDDVLRVTKEISALTSEPFAMNLWVSNQDPGGLDFTIESFERAYRLFEPYFRELGLERPEPPAPREVGFRFEDQVQALIEARPPVFSFVFGIPSGEILSQCRRRGIATVGAATTVAEARLLDEAGVDVIVATGFEAGGHRPSFLETAESSLMGTFSLTQLVSNRVKAPVVAAGGIVDGRGVRAALALGAQGAQIGTAFLACEESGATAEHRAMLFSDRAFHTTLTRGFSGRLARGLSNRFTQEIAARASEIAPYPLQSWFTGALKRAARARVGDARTELVSLWSSQSAPNLQHKSAADLMDSLVYSLTSDSN
ncbi:MAG: nitronate monooxygenase [Polyangiaceae bacterium]|nr:nitronate monooxygenase [Polyangiaceae bacterium]